MPFPLVDGAYTDASRAFTFQQCVNYIPEPSETGGSKTAFILRGAPGLSEYRDFTGNDPCRALVNVEGKEFSVIGNTLKEGALARGFIPGTGRIGVAHNQIAGGNQVVFSTSTGATYVWNTVAETLTQITDPGFPGGLSPVYVDGYIAFIDPSRTFWFHSELNDALSYNTLDRYQGEFSPDKLVCLRVINGNVRAFSQRTIEEYVNTGALTNTFVRNQVIEEGCASEFSAQVIDNSLIWLGSDGIIYRDFAYSPTKVSTFAIDQVLSTLADEWEDAYAFTYSDRGHKVYYLTVGSYTFGYDCATGKWHQRESFGLSYWRVNHTMFLNGAWIAGDRFVSKLYTLAWNTYEEAGQPLVAKRTSGYLFQDMNRVICSAFEVLGSPGTGGRVMLRYSDDNGYSFSNFRSESMGAIGNYAGRAQFTRLGSFRSRIFEIAVSDPVNRDLMGAVMVVQGTEG